ncbi:regulatory iron-sulfur-containing complex subunit RicT [Penaeicola halotolerans]|uniref:PSP1 domain-containing protein n=1 Tax=Penaeicola halotolerans TaxID=2793196 RepID=UPI003F6922F6
MSGCASCGTANSGSDVKGCNNNGTCGTGGCNKMNAFDWLANMDMPIVDKFDIVEVKFKGGRKEYFRNVDNLSLTTGDPVVVDVPNGHHLGFVSLQGELVRLQMQRKKVANNDEITRIYRVATAKDLEKFYEAQARETPCLYRTRQIIEELKLQMKLSDVEFQADNSKATFFYSAEDRVDFRELIKLLAGEFKVRVEMRQISLRQEAGRLGGIGVCGRELCCSTWLSDFKSVGTSAARYQNLSLNPSKLSGQCGRLKCCLNYELDTYMDALQDIPKVEAPLQTEQGNAYLQKTDIFRKIMWFSYGGDSNWHAIETERVKEILVLNEKGKKPVTLLDDELEIADANERLNSDLEQIDKKYAKKKGNKKKKKRRPSDQERSGNSAAKSTNENPSAKREEPSLKRENTNPRPPRDSQQRRPPREGNRPSNDSQTANRGPRPESTPRPERRNVKPQENLGTTGESTENRRPKNNNKRKGRGNNPNRGPKPDTSA